MVGGGVLSLKQAEAAIDFDTITLLLGMMIVVANLRLSGFFRLVTGWAVARARHPALLLVAVVLVSGLLSAFLVNDTVCLVLTPLVLDVVLRLRRNPVPYLLAIAMASNIGSTATITGNPQNMIIGRLSGISYGAFAAALAPIAAIGLVLTVLLIGAPVAARILHRRRLAAEAPPARVHRGLMLQVGGGDGGAMVAFFAGFAAGQGRDRRRRCAAADARVKPEKVYARDRLDFAADVRRPVHRRRRAGAQRALAADRRPPSARCISEIPRLCSGVTAVLSNLVSNVPAVLVLKPFVRTCTTRSARGSWWRWPPRWPAISPWSARSPT